MTTGTNLQYCFTAFSVVPQWAWDLLEQELANVGFEAFYRDEDRLYAYVSHHEETPLNKKTGQFVLPDFDDYFFTYEVESLPARNWNEQWERESFRPLYIDQSLEVRAPHHESECRCDYTILLEPQAAFGAGDHHTTQMMLKLLLQYPVQGKSVVDMGCGTGILGIAALLLGAQKVMLVDIDPLSVTNSQHNLALNGLSANKRVSVEEGGATTPLKRGIRADVYLANIHKNIIIQDLPSYAQTLCAEGVLLLSGFFVSDYHAIAAVLEQTGFVVLQTLQQDEWLAIVARKKE